MKSAFVSMASHELRTPLTAIKEGIRLVVQERTGRLNSEQKEFLGIAQRNVDRLARLINDILDFQKLESGRTYLGTQENDINEIVREIIETMTSLANEKGLNLITQLDDTVPKIKCDKDKIIQVLTNIVNNAIKFTERGSITIATAADDNIAQVSVSDTGPGIKKEDLPKLFNEFEQLAGGGDRKTGGSGLGLAISRKIIEKHNGKIWAESEYGKGATFHFIVPIEERRNKGG
jgi:signal transduction histidine kinase